MRNVMCWHDPVTWALGEFHSSTPSAQQEEVAPLHRTWSHHSGGGKMQRGKKSVENSTLGSDPLHYGRKCGKKNSKKKLKKHGLKWLKMA